MNYVDDLLKQAQVAQEVSARWSKVSAEETLNDVAVINSKIAIIKSGREVAGMTWTALAETISYGADDGPDTDWVRAGKALQGWWSGHTSDEAHFARGQAEDAAVRALQDAEELLEIAPDIASQQVADRQARGEL